jgi:hypothetical protein
MDSVVSGAVGQPVAVTERPSSTQGVVRFELNRSLTGMGHEHYSSPTEAAGIRPADVLARRLFDTGQIEAVHVYSNIVTVELARGGNPDVLPDVVRTLYRYWQPGMQPPSFEDLSAPEDEAAGSAPAASDGGGGGGDAALSAAAQRVPAHLLERSRAGRERWKAKTGG